MTSKDEIGLSSQELGERFDLLATDAKEYAVFLVGLDGRLVCWNIGAQRLFGYQSHEIIELNRFAVGLMSQLGF
jgi:hypothetical protein